MRFLFVNHHANAPQYGNPYRTYYLARELVEAGHHVTIVAASWSHLRHSQPETGGKVWWTQIDGIEYCFLPSPAYGMGSVSRVRNIFGFLFSYRRHWRQIASRVAPDVVVEGTTHILPIYTSRRIARNTGATLIFEARDLWPRTLIDMNGASRYHPFILLISHAMRTALKSCDGVVSTLVGADRFYRESGLPPKAFAHIQNGISPADFAENPKADSPTLTELKAVRQRFDGIIGYAGTIGRVNAVDILLEAASKLARANVAVVFVGKGERVPTLKERVREMGLENVFFLDPVPKSHVASVISNFDLGFVGGKARPIHRYGVSPNKLFDYMAASVPVLFCIDSPDHIVQSAECGYEFPSPTADDIVAATETFFALTAEERAAMGARGRKSVIENNSYHALAARYLQAVIAMGARG